MDGRGMALAPKILYTRQEAATMLSLSLDSLQELMHRGLLAGVRKGRRVLVHRDELERFAAEDTPHIWLPKQKGKTVRAHAAA
jgi:excisionase family DNA binding protein